MDERDGSEERNALGSSDDLSTGIDELLEGMPIEQRSSIKSFMLASFQAGGMASPQMELSKKLTPENIDHFIDADDKAGERDYKKHRDRVIFQGFAIAVTSTVAVAIIILLRGQPEILEKVLYAAGGLVAGIVGGYGYGKSKSED